MLARGWSGLALTDSVPSWIAYGQPRGLRQRGSAQGKPMLACDRHLDGHRDSGTEEVKHNGPATGYANLKTLSFIGSDRQDHVNMFFFHLRRLSVYASNKGTIGLCLTLPCLTFFSPATL